MDACRSGHDTVETTAVVWEGERLSPEHCPRSNTAASPQLAMRSCVLVSWPNHREILTAHGSAPLTCCRVWNSVVAACGR